MSQIQHPYPDSTRLRQVRYVRHRPAVLPQFLIWALSLKRHTTQTALFVPKRKSVVRILGSQGCERSQEGGSMRAGAWVNFPANLCTHNTCKQQTNTHSLSPQLTLIRRFYCSVPHITCSQCRNQYYAGSQVANDKKAPPLK
jgi:hypothetical protein